MLNNNFYIFAYSIGSFDNFELKLENNTKIEYINYAKLFLFPRIINLEQEGLILIL